jgi:hypothetical protein
MDRLFEESRVKTPHMVYIEFLTFRERYVLTVHKWSSAKLCLLKVLTNAKRDGLKMVPSIR